MKAVDGYDCPFIDLFYALYGKNIWKCRSMTLWEQSWSLMLMCQNFESHVVFPYVKFQRWYDFIFLFWILWLSKGLSTCTMVHIRVFSVCSDSQERFLFLNFFNKNLCQSYNEWCTHIGDSCRTWQLIVGKNCLINPSRNRIHSIKFVWKRNGIHWVTCFILNDSTSSCLNNGSEGCRLFMHVYKDVGSVTDTVLTIKVIRLWANSKQNKCLILWKLSLIPSLGRDIRWCAEEGDDDGSFWCTRILTKKMQLISSSMCSFLNN